MGQVDGEVDGNVDGEIGRVYARAGFGHPVARGVRPAIVVVDFSQGFTDPTQPTGADMSAAVLATADLLEHARNAGVPIAFTTIAYESQADGGTWLRKAPGLAALMAGTPAVELDPRLSRRPDELLVVKKAASAFFGTSLAAWLVGQQIDTLIVTGATTSGCVRATIVDAVSYGWPTLVPRECVADRAQAPHDATLFDIDQKYADVVTADDVRTYLSQISDRATGE